MDIDALLEEITLEFSRIEDTLACLEDVVGQRGEEEPQNHELAAIGAYLCNFYNGIENTLKRIAKAYQVNIPGGENWHIALLEIFREQGVSNLPPLMDKEMMDDLDAFRGFRHLFVHGYAILLRWDKLKPNVENARPVYEKFQKRIFSHITR